MTSIEKDVWLDYAIPAKSINDYDIELKNLLCYNPDHNFRTNNELNLGFDLEYLNDPNRPPIETDRGGWRYYYKVYSKYLVPLKNQNLKMLEVGVEHGYGVLAWARYFQNFQIYGMEREYEFFKPSYDIINKKFSEYANRINIKKGNSRLQDDWKLAFNYEQFDIIIDDGSHVPIAQSATLTNGLPYVKSGGYYFIEDVKHDSKKQISIDNDHKLFDQILEHYKNGDISYLKIYSHISPSRYNLMSLTDSELYDYWFNLYTVRNNDKQSFSDFDNVERTVNYRLKNDSYNPYNFMVVMKKA